MESFCFIGTRQPRSLSRSWYQLYTGAAEFAARRGFAVHSGAMPGAEQLAAETALAAGGLVRLYLPWEGYEPIWCRNQQNRHPSRVETVVYDPEIHTSWTEAIHQWHPAGTFLARASLGLYARTYGMVGESTSVVALPYVRLKSGAADKGQTEQGLTVARELELVLYDLSEEEGRTALRDLLAQR
jgi:hypothetical protein